MSCFQTEHKEAELQFDELMREVETRAVDKRVREEHTETGNGIMCAQSQNRDELQRVKDTLGACEQALTGWKELHMNEPADTEFLTAKINKLKEKRDELLETLVTSSAQLTGPAGKSWMVGL
jgi:hypothetical protein